MGLLELGPVGEPMRAFEFHPGELEDAHIRVAILDLDSVVMFQEKLYTGGEYSRDRIGWTVTLSSNEHLFLTRPAFDRILQAWKSK